MLKIILFLIALLPNTSFAFIDDEFVIDKRNEVISRINSYSNFYILMDQDTGEILLEKNPLAEIPPSSMTKIMTAYVVFDQIKKGNLGLHNQCFVSKKAWRNPRQVRGASKMFLNYGDLVSTEKLIEGLLVASGNDAAITLAESIAGNLDFFISLMNLKAIELGLKNSHFKNPSGLNDHGHYMSVRDLAILTRRIRLDFPEYMKYFTLPNVTYNHITQKNHNPLFLGGYAGVTGMKTGYTIQGKYGVVGTATRNNRNLIAVVNQVNSSKERSRVITELLDYGFNNFREINLFHKNESITRVKLLFSDKKEIEFITKNDISFFLPKDITPEMIKVTVNYKGPLYGPIERNKEIANLVIDLKNYKKLTYPLYTKESVKKASRLERMRQKLQYKIESFTGIF